MELIKLVKNPSGAIVASIYKDGCFIRRSFYGYSVKAVFSNLRAFIFILEESCNRWNLKGLFYKKRKKNGYY